VDIDGEDHNICCASPEECADCGDHGPDETCEPIDLSAQDLSDEDLDDDEGEDEDEVRRILQDHSLSVI